jgi:hypothetical protein
MYLNINGIKWMIASGREIIWKEDVLGFTPLFDRTREKWQNGSGFIVPEISCGNQR